jgi:hypothetical protein
MKIMGLGLNYAGQALFPPREEAEVVANLMASLAPNAARMQHITTLTQRTYAFRGERQRVTIDPGDPKSAGWTYLVNAKDPQRADIARILEPLAKWRGMADPASPLLYNGEPQDDWVNWLDEHYTSLALEGDKVPQYVLIAGGPDQVPFLFHSLLDTAAKVGRVAFDRLEDLDQYVKKVIRIESQPGPLVNAQVALFAPDGGQNDPTYFSRQYMVEPLAKYIHDELKLDTCVMEAGDATKKNLVNMLSTSKPAMVYTASHGLGATDQPADFQKRYNGAICCQHQGGLTLNDLFTADDVPLDKPFLEGSVFFQFACFGYGTPAQSDYSHWLSNVPEKYTDADFVAALPKKLLAHPRGPIGYIGHLDTAFLQGFTDAEAPFILDRWHQRIEPFKSAIDQLLMRVQPSGLAMEDMNARYNSCNAIITGAYDQQQRGRLQWTDQLKARFLDTWLRRSDAQNYMVFGDPAVRLRIPA